jgi:two-component system, NarL family, sensor histidine kinase UhpB
MQSESPRREIVNVMQTDDVVELEMSDSGKSVGRNRLTIEASSREYEERYSALVSATSNKVWVANANGDIMEDVQYWEEATGQSPEVYKSWGWVRALHPDDAEWVERKWRETVRARTSIEIEYRIRLQTGEYRRICARGVPIPAERGEFRGWVGTITDVEDQRRAEDSLRKSENLMRRAFDVARLYAWEYDFQTGAVAYSDNISNLTGFDYKKVGPDLEGVMTPVHPDDRATITQKIEEAISSGRFEVDYRITYPAANQPIRWFHASGETVYDKNGAALRLIGVSQDISERREADDALRANSEQLRALSARLNSAREEEGARIARELHDELGSALTSLKWDLERLGKLNQAEDLHLESQARRKKIEGMKESIDSIINTVRRISSELRPSLLDNLGLAAAIEWQAKQFETRANIPCRFSNTLDRIELSKEQITEVFRIFKECMTNILRHAHATRVDIRIGAKEGDLIFEIEDNGIGITDAQRKSSGSLGLLGMRERATLIGGKIEIQGIENHGTVVTLSIPGSPHVYRKYAKHGTFK